VKEAIPGHLHLPAPAKLNLFLHVTGRRDDGYHTLETLFTFIDLRDQISLACRQDGQLLRSEGPAEVPPQEDLCLRAAALLRAETGVAAGAEIGLRKRIPLGGGVGGGSSDAATVLVGLNRLWGCGLDEDALAGLGLLLGADVPVFVRGRAAFAGGVGERLQPLPLPPQWFVLACPPVQVSTAGVFSDPSLTRDTKPLKIGGFPWDTDGQAALDALWRASRNDCEPVVRAAQPAVAAVLDWLGERAPTRMSGSGACVFARVGDGNLARALARECRQAMNDRANWGASNSGHGGSPGSGGDWRVLAVRGLNRSPLHECLEQPDAAD
jgi:4-diphosphocytidyl-2-C-methyl-D-erythritol kinase